MFQLTKGSLRKILDGNEVSNPILQILQMKNIQNNQDGMTRYKVTLFDGEIQHTFGILATQKNSLVENNELRIGSVIRLEEFASNVLSKDPPKVVVILLNFEILGDMDTKTTTPNLNEPVKPAPKVQNENVEPKSEVQSNTKSFFGKADNTATNSVQKVNKPTLSTSVSTTSNCQSDMFNNFKIIGISSLNPYQNKWSIKARVTNKSPIRTYSNAKGEGKLFNVEFIDSTGQIRASGFNVQLDKFYDMLNIDNVYYVSRAMLKTANRQYSKIDNDYEMTFTNDTVIEQCHEADSVPHVKLELLQLSDIVQKNAGDLVDIIAVVKSTSDLSSITVKSTNKELTKRELYLVDSSNTQVNCTLWGKQAEEFDGSEFPVLLLKGAKVGDYGGRSLSVIGQTSIQINPDIPEAHAIRGWFDHGGNEAQTNNLSNQGMQTGGSSSGSAGLSQTWKTLDSIRDDQLGMSDKGDYFSVKGIVLYAKKDNSMYMACAGENCNKKVVDQNDGTYRCEKCQKNYQEFKWRMILNINLCDFTDSNWVTLFQDTAECILDTRAEELGALKNANDPNYDEIFANAVFKEYNFRLRAKMETYNDERRVKVTAVGAEPIDYPANSRRLLAKIKQFAKENP